VIATRLVALASALVATIASCGGADDVDARADSGRPAILPAFAQQRNNAQASIPGVPFSQRTPRWVARASHWWPHDSLAYTQGLLARDGVLLESTGLEGHSDLRTVDRATGRMLQRALLPDSEFGEGIASIGDRVYQLTWQSGHGRVYDAHSLAVVDSFTYDGEGWGLATDDTLLYLSDGTSGVRVIDPNGFRVVRRLRVTEAGHGVHMLNELEWVRGELWANVYETTLVARIDPATGRVIGWIDLSMLLPEAQRDRLKDRGGVANGIAYDRATDRVLVTGKYWPYLFQLDSIPGVASSRASRRLSPH
jgi:glutaminyl-peptide cyclotransferase